MLKFKSFFQAVVDESPELKTCFTKKQEKKKHNDRIKDNTKLKRPKLLA